MRKRLITAALLAMPLLAQTVIQVRVTPANPSLSDEIRVDVSVVGTGAADSALLPVEIRSDCVRILEVRDEGNRRVIRLDPLQAGACKLPPFRARCIGGATRNCEVVSGETVFPIHTVVKYEDIRDGEEEPYALPDAWSPPWLALLLLPLGVIAWMLYRAYKRPDRRAERRLKRAEPGEAYNIFRDYLVEHFKWNARSATSHELAQALRGLFAGQAAEELHGFLHACDQHRFSSTPALNDEAIETCRELIQFIQVESRRQTRARV